MIDIELFSDRVIFEGSDEIEVSEEQVTLLRRKKYLFSYKKLLKNKSFVNYTCTTRYNNSPDKNCKAFLTVKYKKPHFFHKKIADKYLVFSLDCHSKKCYEKAKKRAQKKIFLDLMKEHPFAALKELKALFTNRIKEVYQIGEEEAEAQTKEKFPKILTTLQESRHLIDQVGLGYLSLESYRPASSEKPTNKTVIYYSDIFIELAEHSQLIIFDKGFPIKPSNFDEFLIVTFKDEYTGNIYPLAFALLGGLLRDCYDDVFFLIKQKIKKKEDEWENVEFYSDFDETISNAIYCRICIEAIVKNCYFHLRHLIFRKFRKLNINKSKLRLLNKMIYSEFFLFLFSKGILFSDFINNLKAKIKEWWNGKKITQTEKGKYSNLLFYFTENKDYFLRIKTYFKDETELEISSSYMRNILCPLKAQITEPIITEDSLKQHAIFCFAKFLDKHNEQLQKSLGKPKINKKRKSSEIGRSFLREMIDAATQFDVDILNQQIQDDLKIKEKEDFLFHKDEAEMEVECLEEIQDKILQKKDEVEKIKDIQMKDWKSSEKDI